MDPSLRSTSAVHRFRSTEPRQPLHPREKLLLGIIVAHLSFLPWALGTAPLWAQLISLAFAFLGFIVALSPRYYTSELAGGPPFSLLTWPKLLRFPLFWVGLALFAYIALQGFNPAWEYIERDRLWWMQQIPHIDWLPQGTRNPFRLGGPWRLLLIYASAWLVVCSIWVGFTRRRTLRYLLVALISNGVLFTAFALLQRLTDAKQIYWSWTSPNASFFGSFIYKNHAGAYLLLILGATCALAAWHYVRGRRKLEKSTPVGVLVFFATILAVAIYVSYARGATLFAALFLAFAAGVALVLHWRQPAELRKPFVGVVFLLGLGAFLYVGADSLSAERAWRRLQRIADASDVTIGSRQAAARAAFDMFKDNWAWGTGAGSFRFLFPAYQQNYPEIFEARKHRQFWDFAHNDIIQIPAELGAFGIAVIAFGFCFWLWRLLSVKFIRSPLSVLLVGCAVVLVAHSWTDFLFYNPAILITWCSLWPIAALWPALEERRR